MFHRARSSTHPDLSSKLQSDVKFWNISPSLSVITLHTLLGPSVVCVDSLSELFAIGTLYGEIRIFDNKFREIVLLIPQRDGKQVGVRLLTFARPREGFKLVCVDTENTLHIWNLDIYGKPQLQISETFDSRICRIAVSQSHSHAFIALQKGDIRAYNLMELKKSSYEPSCPSSELPALPAGCISNTVVDIVLLPQDLGHLIISYNYVVVLYDIVSRKIMRMFHRDPLDSNDAPMVTTVSLHPSSRLIAVGYEDGYIYLWDITSSKPLWVGSVERSKPDSGLQLEPIFHLEWTLHFELSWLSVLGGHLPNTGQGDGVTVLTFPTEIQSNGDTASVRPQLYWYRSAGVVQDFAILPTTDKGAGAFGTIFMIVEESRGTTVQAFQYPPISAGASTVDEANDKAINVDFSAEFEESAEISRTLDSTLQEMEDLCEEYGSDNNIDVVPLAVDIPFQLYAGSNAVTAVQMVVLDKNAYLQLTGYQSSDPSDSYSFLISQHQDATVRFHDISLLSGLSLVASPQPLSHLTIRVFDVPELALRPDIQNLHIENVVFGKESLECCVHLSSGDIVIFGIGKATRTHDDLGDDIVDVRDNHNSESGRFTPRYIIKGNQSKVILMSLSDIGFLAIAYQDGLLSLIDLRGPRIIMRNSYSSAETKHHEAAVIESLNWSICGTLKDAKLSPRLISTRSDGSLSILTLELKSNGWEIEKSGLVQETHTFLKKSIFSAVIDAKTGKLCSATPPRLALILDKAESPSTQPAGLDTYLVVASRKEMRCLHGVIGDKVSRVVFPNDGVPITLKLLNYEQSSVVVAICKGHALIYSIPGLNVIHSFKLDKIFFEHSDRSHLSCTENGDILHANLNSDGSVLVQVTTLFSQYVPSTVGKVNFRAYKFIKGEFIKGGATGATSAGNSTDNDANAQSWSAWIKGAFSTTVTGDEIDALLSPPEEPKPANKAPSPLLESGSGSSTSKGKNKQSSNTQSFTEWGQGVYNQLTVAATERGERLNELQEQFKHLETGGRDLALQAKKMAEQQAAKRWFQF